MLIELTFPCLQHSTDQSMHLQTAPLPFCMLNNCLGEPLQWCSPICYQLNFSLFLFIEIADFLLVCLKGHKWSCFSSFLSLASAWTIFWLLVIVSWLSCVAKSDSCFLCVTCFSDFPRQCSTHRSSHRKCSMIKDNLENFTKLTGKHLFQSLFLIWQMLSCKICEIFKNIFFTEHLWTTASIPMQYLTSHLMGDHLPLTEDTHLLH